MGDAGHHLPILHVDAGGAVMRHLRKWVQGMEILPFIASPRKGAAFPGLVRACGEVCRSRKEVQIAAFARWVSTW
jgi:hypothetical protein